MMFLSSFVSSNPLVRVFRKQRMGRTSIRPTSITATACYTCWFVLRVFKLITKLLGTWVQRQGGSARAGSLILRPLQMFTGQLEGVKVVMMFSCVVRVYQYVGGSLPMQAMDSCFCALGKVVVETVHISSVMRCEEFIDCL